MEEEKCIHRNFKYNIFYIIVLPFKGQSSKCYPTFNEIRLKSHQKEKCELNMGQDLAVNICFGNCPTGNHKLGHWRGYGRTGHVGLGLIQ